MNPGFLPCQPNMFPAVILMKVGPSIKNCTKPLSGIKVDKGNYFKKMKYPILIYRHVYQKIKPAYYITA